MDQSLYGMLMRAESGLVTSERLNSEIFTYLRTLFKEVTTGNMPLVSEINPSSIQREILHGFEDNLMFKEAVVGDKSLTESYHELFSLSARTLRFFNADRNRKELKLLAQLIGQYNPDDVSKFLEKEIKVYVDHIMNGNSNYDADILSSEVKSVIVKNAIEQNSLSVQYRSPHIRAQYLDEKIVEFYRIK